MSVHLPRARNLGRCECSPPSTSSRARLRPHRSRPPSVTHAGSWVTIAWSNPSPMEARNTRRAGRTEPHQHCHRSARWTRCKPSGGSTAALQSSRWRAPQAHTRRWRREQRRHGRHDHRHGRPVDQALDLGRRRSSSASAARRPPTAGWGGASHHAPQRLKGVQLSSRATCRHCSSTLPPCSGHRRAHRPHRSTCCEAVCIDWRRCTKSSTA